MTEKTPLSAEKCLYTIRKYPCGCSAEGPGDVPPYCSEHGEPPPKPYQWAQDGKVWDE